MPVKVLVCGFFALIASVAICQYTEAEVIDKITSLQTQQDKFYDRGLFPVRRSWSFSSKSVADNAIFFTASTITTLQLLRPFLTSEDNAFIEKMIRLADPTYKKYRSRNGEVTYNFWQTLPPDLPFPNGNKLISNQKMRLPDDYDTSLMIALADGKTNGYDTLLRKKMVSYARRENRAQSELLTLDKYLSSKAYEVWFAKKMPQTFDICVMSNVLLFNFVNGFKLNEIDHGTIDLIKRMINADDHLLHPQAISHHATSPSVILYHVARMMAYDHEGHFEDLENKLKEDASTLFMTSDSEMEKVMLLSTMYRLSGEPNSYTINENKLKQQIAEFSFFTVNPFRQNFTRGLNHVLPTISWVSEAYNWTLLFEYLTLKKASLSN